MQKAINENKIEFADNKAYEKKFKSEENKTKKYKSLMLELGSSSTGTKEIKKKFNNEKIFSNPKPTILLKQILKIANTSNDFILDFFAGSGTTGDAVMQLNAKDEGNRKFILVQLDEKLYKQITKEEYNNLTKSEKKKYIKNKLFYRLILKDDKIAYNFVKDELKVEDPTIFEITKERLIRAGKEIKKENIDKPAKSERIKCAGIKEEHCFGCEGEYTLELKATKQKDLSNIDFGFKVFETISNNEGVWEDYKFKTEAFDPQTKLFDETKLKENDLKTLLTTWKTYDGIQLTQSLKEISLDKLDNYKGYYFNNKLYLIDRGFKTENLIILLEEINKNNDFNPTTIIGFGYNFESKILIEIAESIKNDRNKKNINIDFIIR